MRIFGFEMGVFLLAYKISPKNMSNEKKMIMLQQWNYFLKLINKFQILIIWDRGKRFLHATPTIMP